MKNILYFKLFLRIIILHIFFCVLSLSQSGGRFLSATGTMKVLVVFAQLNGDNFETGDPNWLVNQLPRWKDSLFSPTAQSDYSQYLVSDYFKTMSNGTYNVIGDYYPSLVVTNQTEASYIAQKQNYCHVNREIIQTIDPNVNFSLYDNWTFNYDYSHSYNPDGYVDMIIIIYRHINNKSEFTTYGSATGIAALGDRTNFTDTTDENKIIRGADMTGMGSGLTIFGRDNDKRLYAVLPLVAHEYGHYILGYHISGYGLMPAVATISPTMNAVERQKLGYMTITEINSSCNRTLPDYLTSNPPIAYKVAIPNSNDWYLIENHQKISKFDAVGGWDDHKYPDTTGKGLHIFRIINSNGGNIIECADGRWNWLYVCTSPNPIGPGNIDVYKKNYPDPLNGHNKIEQGILFKKDTCNLQASDYSNDVAGYNDESFKVGYNQIFSPWSNPRSINYQNQNVAIEIQSQNGSAFSINIYINDSYNAQPAKPSINTVTKVDGKGYITWYANSEPNLSGYNVYRAVYYPNQTTINYVKINPTLIPVGTTNYLDRIPLPSGLPERKKIYCKYKITAVNSDSKESLKSDESAEIYKGQTADYTYYSSGSSTLEVPDGLLIMQGACTITSTGTLILSQNSRLEFCDNAGLTINGTFTANNTTIYCPNSSIYINGSADLNNSMVEFNSSSSAVYVNSNFQVSGATFKGNGTANSWTGLIYNYTLNGLSGCSIKDANYGITTPGVYTILNSGCRLENNVNGAYINNYGGIEAAGTVFNNTGVDVTNDNTSYTFLGDATTHGNNSFRKSDNSYHVVNSSAGSISAQYNYWVNSQPRVSGSVNTTNPLGSDPNPLLSRITKNLIVTNEILSKVNNIQNNQVLVKEPGDEEFSKGTSLYYSGKYNEALSLFEQLIAKYPNSIIANKSVIFIEIIYDKQKKSSDVIGKLETISDNFKSNSIAKFCEYRKTYRYIQKGEYDNAISLAKSISIDNDLTLSKMKLYDLFRWNLVYKENVSEAEKYYTQLLSDYPDDILTSIAKLMRKRLETPGNNYKNLDEGSGKNIISEEKGSEFELNNYPNPFNPSTIIHYNISKYGHVKLVVYDMLGREVKTLVNQYQPAGKYSVTFDGASLTSGVYYYKIEAGGIMMTKRMMLTK